MMQNNETPELVEHKIAQQNKRYLLWRIFRWFGISFLILLLITLLVFRAPWKIITLLSIVLAACTFFPITYRKWFWISVGAVLIVLVIWILLPEDNEDWRPYTFEKEIALHEAEYAIPDGENAAIAYNELIQDYDPQKMGLKFLRPGVRKIVLSDPWISADYPELVQWLQGHENTIRILPRVCRIKACRFPANFKLTVNDKLQINRYTALRSWAVLLLLSANNDIAEKRLDEGMLKYNCVLQIADHLYQQKRMIDLLIGFGIEGLILPLISRLVIEEQLGDKQLEFVSDNLKNLENNWSSDFLQCLEYDKLFVKNTFCSLVFEKDEKDRIRYSRHPSDAIWGRFRPRKKEETYWQKKSMKAYAISAWFTLPAAPQKATEIIEKVYEEYHAMAESGFDWNRQTIGPTPSFELNCRFLIWLITIRTSRSYSGFHDIYMKRVAQRRGLRLLVAIRQYRTEHGAWPDSLDAIKSNVPAEALIDPVTGNEFVYENHGERFSLFAETVNIWPK